VNKVTVSFEFDSIQDEDYKYITQGKDYYLACVEFSNYLRGCCKYGNEDLVDGKLEVYKLRDKFHHILAENDVSV
jgi:hypothetical protein